MRHEPLPARHGLRSLARLLRGGLPGPRSRQAFQYGPHQSPFRQEEQRLLRDRGGGLEKEDVSYERQDFWTTTKNKQLNFLQHVFTLLDMDGRCAIVVPDNVLFEGGAGETVRRRLLRQCEVHTLLRLPTGIWYSPGVKANVLFFDKRPGREEPWTRELWVYDLRTNQHFTLKKTPLRRHHLDEFIELYNPENRYERKPTYTEGRSVLYGRESLTR